jgi:hypothetical protein
VTVVESSSSDHIPTPPRHHHSGPALRLRLHNFLPPPAGPPTTLLHKPNPRPSLSPSFLSLSHLPAAPAGCRRWLIPRSLSSPKSQLPAVLLSTIATYCVPPERGGRGERRDGFLGASKNHMMPLPPPPSFLYLGISFSSAFVDPSLFSAA